MCPRISWTCWYKFHLFYLPNKLFTEKGVIRRGFALAQLKGSANVTTEAATVTTEAATATTIIAMISDIAMMRLEWLTSCCWLT